MATDAQSYSILEMLENHTESPIESEMATPQMATPGSGNTKQTHCSQKARNWFIV